MLEKLCRTAFCLIILITKASAIENASREAPPEEPLSLWYRQPAKQWEEALPLGNGRLGAMIFGGVARETLQLNEDTFWSGQPYQQNNPDCLKTLPEVRRLVFDGKFAEAEKLVNSGILARPSCQCCYQTVGNLLLDFPTNGPITGYQRDLNLDAATAAVRYAADGVSYLRETFISPVDQVLVMRLAADKPGRISFTAGLTCPRESKCLTEGDDTILMRIDSGGDGRNGIKGAVKCETRVKVLHQGGKLAALDGKLSLVGADSATILLDTGTSFRAYNDIAGDPAAGPRDHVAKAAVKPVDKLRADHLASHRALFRRVAFDLGASDASLAPTDERRVNFAKGAHDPQLPVLYYQFGRYLLICSSRPGTQPANLQGIWNDKTLPPWDSKYTININTEMNYWPSETANLSELGQPLFKLVAEIAETGRETASVQYGAKGWVCHHNTDIWRATGAIDGAFWGMWPMGGAWLCTHLWEHYQFSGDRAFLEKAYPILRGACEFYQDFLVEDPVSGRLVTCPSISPENRHPHGSSICAGPSMDMSILRDLFEQTATAAAILGKDPEFRKRILETRSRLVPLQIGKGGQLMEWKDDWDLEAPEQHHRHISHLYALFPSTQIDLRRTPELAAAAAKSLDTRGDISTGWAIGWRINCRARLHDGDRTYKIVKALLDPSRTYPNLFDAHPPFQIDGNFAGTSGMTEMLLQSQVRIPSKAGLKFEIELLPALPSAWPDGRISGIRARGGYVVDLTWKAGKLVSATLHSAKGGSHQIRYGDLVVPITLAAGESVTLDGTLKPKP